MEITHAAAILQIVNELTDSGFIVGNVIKIMNGTEPADSDGLLYERLLKKAVQKNPQLGNIDDEILNKAEEEFFRVIDTRILVEKAVSAVRDYLGKDQ